MGASAISRDIIENDLINTHHWLPQDIAKIPYKNLQKMFLINKHRNEMKMHKDSIDEFKRQTKSTGRGSGKRYRNV